jgi:hypothetical protein
MIAHYSSASHQAAIELEGTGTFADGAFLQMVVAQREVDRQRSLRTSYGHDHSIARQTERAVPLFGDSHL